MSSDALELVGLPVGGPTSVPMVKVQLAISADDSRDDDRLGAVVDAVNAMVRTWRVSAAAVGSVDWPDRIAYGATLLAARYYRRKNSPAGVEAVGSGAVAYVMRTDPDVAQLLQLGAASPPTVG